MKTYSIKVRDTQIEELWVKVKAETEEEARHLAIHRASNVDSVYWDEIGEGTLTVEEVREGDHIFANAPTLEEEDER